MGNFIKDIKLPSQITVEFAIMLIWCVSVAFNLFVAAAFLLTFLIPDIHLSLIDTFFTLSNQDLSLYFAINFISIFLVIIYRMIKREAEIIYLFRSTRQEAIIYIVTAIFFSHFFASNFIFLRSFYSISLALGIVFFILFLPMLVNFYKSGFQKSYQSFKKGIQVLWKIKDTKGISFLRIVLSYLVFIAGLVIFLGLVALVVFKSFEYAAYQRKIKGTLSITKAVPAKLIVGEKMSLLGNNFGWRTDPNDRLMSNYGSVAVETWTEQKLDFYIPLQWKEGVVNLWVVRNKTDNPPFYTYKSNVARLMIESRWSYFPTDDEINNDSPKSVLSKIIKKIKRKILLGKD